MSERLLQDGQTSALRVVNDERTGLLHQYIILIVLSISFPFQSVYSHTLQKVIVFWFVAQCSAVEVYHYFPVDGGSKHV
jgi:hypothetical protein